MPEANSKPLSPPSESKALARRPANDIEALLSNPDFKHKVALALPAHMKPERLIRVACNALLRTPKLRDCSVVSFTKALLDLSSFGLEPDGRRAHLIPYGTDVQLVIDYKGLAELVRRSGDVSYIHADVVGENDLFDYQFGTGAKLVHKPKLNGRGKIYCAYSFVRLKDGSEDFDVMDIVEIDKIKQRSKAYTYGMEKNKKDSPWFTDENEMRKKGLALTTPIPTPDGWTTMGDLSVGDTVFDSMGEKTVVMDVSEVKNISCYEVEFANGYKIVCDNEHRWIAKLGSNASTKAFQVYGIGELFSARRNKISVVIPIQPPINTGSDEPAIDAWLLGYWLGNGHSFGASITCHQDDSSEIADIVKCSPYILGKIRKDERSKAVTIGIKHGFKEALQAFGILANKHIPTEFLRASKRYRLELLRGLMDSDGHIDAERGACHFGSVLEPLRDGFVELLSSLGQPCSFNESDMNGYGKTVRFYTVLFRPDFHPCLLSRKLKNYKRRNLAKYNSIKAIKEVPSVPTRCIAVDSATESYLCGRFMVPTHNTVFRRHSKWLPLSPEIQDAIQHDEEPMTEQERFAASRPIFGREQQPDGMSKALTDAFSQVPENGEEKMADPARDPMTEAEKDFLGV